MDDLEGLDVENFLTSFFGLAQTLSTWLLYVTATDASRSVRQLVDPTKGSMHITRGGGRVIPCIRYRPT